MSRGRHAEPLLFVSTYRGASMPQTDRAQPALVELWRHPDPARADYRAPVTEGTVRIAADALNALTGVPVTPIPGQSLTVPRGMFSALMREAGWTEGEAP
jgi:hypothetical protein